MLYKIGCNPMHPLCGALSGSYVPVRVTRGAVIAHRFTYAPLRCRTSQYRRTFIPLSVSLWNDVSDPLFDGVRLAGFKSTTNAFLLACCSLIFCLLLFSLSLLSFCGLVLWGWGLRTDRVLIALFQPCIANLFLITIIIIVALKKWGHSTQERGRTNYIVMRSEKIENHKNSNHTKINFYIIFIKKNYTIDIKSFTKGG